MIEVCFFYLTLFQKWFLACCFNNLFFFREFFVDDEASDGKEEADGYDDVVPWVGAEWEVVWCDGLPHVEPWVEGYDSDADEADIDRKTFYAHYQNVTDVYLELGKEMAEQLREVLIDVDSFEVDDFLESLNDIMLANLSFFKIITSKSADKFFLTDFIWLLRETLLLRYSELTFTSASFLSHGIIGAYVDWLNGENQSTLADLKESLGKLLRFYKDAL